MSDPHHRRHREPVVWEAFLEQATAYGDGDEAGERLVRYTLAATEQQEEVLKEWERAVTGHLQTLGEEFMADVTPLSQTEGGGKAAKA